MTSRQSQAVAALRANIARLDIDARRTDAGDRIFKTWTVSIQRDGSVVITSVVGWPTHRFDDIRRVVTVGARGGLKGFGNASHTRHDTTVCRGPRMLYEIDAQRIY